MDRRNVHAPILQMIQMDHSRTSTKDISLITTRTKKYDRLRIVVTNIPSVSFQNHPTDETRSNTIV
jgi:hypothetical protein